MDFVDWLSVKLAYKLSQFKSLLSDNVVNKRKSLQPKTYQDIYNFWLNISINSNDSRSNVIKISKHFFLHLYKLSRIKISWKRKIYQKWDKENFIHWKKIYTDSLTLQRPMFPS